MTPSDTRLSLCMIVRDEADMLPDCLDSVSGVVDEMIVVDTGSTDGTRRIAADLGARVLRHDWQEHFAEARNASLDAAGGDWVLWLDADERLRRNEHDRLRKLIAEARADAFLVPIVSPHPTGSHVTRGHRLFRNRKEIRFSGRIHEQVWPTLKRAGARVGVADFTIDHLGYNLEEQDQERKNRRNLRMLQTAKEEDPGDSYIRFTLGQVHMLMGDWAAAEREIRTALGEHRSEKMHDPLPPDIRASAHTNLANCAIQRAAPVEALVRCDQSLQTRPHQVTAHLMAYRAHKALEQEQEALETLRTVEELMRAPRPNGGAAIEIAVEPSDLWRAMGYSCLRLSRPAEAERHFLKALDREPRHARTIAALARCAVARDQLDRALSRAEESLSLAPADDSLLDLISFILLKMGRLDEAVEWLGELRSRRPGDQSLKRRLAGVLVKLGRAREAADLIADTNGVRSGAAAPSVKEPQPATAAPHGAD